MPFDLGYPAHQANFARPGAMGFSLQSFFALFPSEEAALRYVFAKRFGNGPKCRRCNIEGRWTKVPGRPLFRHGCSAVSSPLARTLCDRTYIPAHLWLYAMLHFANSANSASAVFLQRHLGIGSTASFHMAMRIRLHLAALDTPFRIGGNGGVVVARLVSLNRVSTPKGRAGGTSILALTDSERVISIVVPKPRRHRLRPLLLARIHQDTTLKTDCYRTYRCLGAYGVRAPLAAFDPLCLSPHSESSDPIAGFFASFRRGLRTQHRCVSEHKLWTYLKEYEFRFNRRMRSQDIYPDMIGQFPSLQPSDVASLRAANFRPLDSTYPE